MNPNNDDNKTPPETTAGNTPFFSELRDLAEHIFPKHCTNCGREFLSVEQFLEEAKIESTVESKVESQAPQPLMENVSAQTLLKTYCYCLCGTRLMDFFSERRDCSEAGVRRRMKFQKLLDELTDKGMDRDSARQELLKMLRGEESEEITRALGEGSQIL